MRRSEARVPGLRRQCECASDTDIAAGAYCPRCGGVVIYNPADVERMASQQVAALGDPDAPSHGHTNEQEDGR